MRRCGTIAAHPAVDLAAEPNRIIKRAQLSKPVRLRRNALIIIEKTNRNYFAYSPDLPGRIATGNTRDQTTNRMRQAITLPIQALKDDGEAIPVAQASADSYTVSSV